MAALLASWARSEDSLRSHGKSLASASRLRSPTAASEEPEASRKAQRQREEKLAAFGHESIGEHAVVHLAAEGVSHLVARAALDSRTVSFVEKSGSYRTAQTLRLVEPEGLDSPAARGAWTEATERLLEVREAISPALDAGTRRLHPQGDDESEEKWERRITSIVRSIRRQLLPLAVSTDLALTVNARGLRSLLDKLSARPEQEAKVLSERLGEAAGVALPALMPSHAEVRYRTGTQQAIGSWAHELLENVGTSIADDQNHAKLVRTPEDVEARLVTAILYRFSDLSYGAVRTRVEELDQDARTAVLDEYLRRRGRHDDPLRDLEHVHYTFEVMLDGVALHEVQRHRISSRTPQTASASHGYLVDPELVEAGMAPMFRTAMDGAQAAFLLLREIAPKAADYVLPLGFRQRVLISWNLRSLHHFVQQRSSRTGNRSVRHIAQDVYREVERVHPIVARTLRVDMSGADDEGGR